MDITAIWTGIRKVLVGWKNRRHHPAIICCNDRIRYSRYPAEFFNKPIFPGCNIIVHRCFKSV